MNNFKKIGLTALAGSLVTLGSASAGDLSVSGAINTTLKFEDKSQNEKKSYFEIVFATIIQTNEEVKEKKDMEKIILCDVQIEIYPDLEKAFLNLVHASGHPNIKLEKKVDFNKLYNERFN